MNVHRQPLTEREIAEALHLATADQLRAAILRRIREDADEPDDYGEFIYCDDLVEDQPALEEAAARWQRGERQEALHWLERALGSDFAGLGDLRREDLE